MSVAGILRNKGYAVVTASPTDTIAAVAAKLAEKRIGAVLVLDGMKQLLGILSERDIIRLLASHGAAALDMPAAQAMTRRVSTVAPHTDEASALSLMTEGRFRHLPVVDQGTLIGMISIGDVVKARLQQQEHEVDSLKAYVAGAM